MSSTKPKSYQNVGKPRTIKEKRNIEGKSLQVRNLHEKTHSSVVLEACSTEQRKTTRKKQNKNKERFVHEVRDVPNLRITTSVGGRKIELSTKEIKLNSSGDSSGCKSRNEIPRFSSSSVYDSTSDDCCSHEETSNDSDKQDSNEENTKKISPNNSENVEVIDNSNIEEPEIVKDNKSSCGHKQIINFEVSDCNPTEASNQNVTPQTIQSVHDEETKLKFGLGRGYFKKNIENIFPTYEVQDNSSFLHSQESKEKISREIETVQFSPVLSGKGLYKTGIGRGLLIPQKIKDSENLGLTNNETNKPGCSSSPISPKSSCSDVKLSNFFKELPTAAGRGRGIVMNQVKTLKDEKDFKKSVLEDKNSNLKVMNADVNESSAQERTVESSECEKETPGQLQIEVSSQLTDKLAINQHIGYKLLKHSDGSSCSSEKDNTIKGEIDLQILKSKKKETEIVKPLSKPFGGGRGLVIKQIHPFLSTANKSTNEKKNELEQHMNWLEGEKTEDKHLSSSTNQQEVGSVELDGNNSVKSCEESKKISESNPCISIENVECIEPKTSKIPTGVLAKLYYKVMNRDNESNLNQEEEQTKCVQLTQSNDQTVEFTTKLQSDECNQQEIKECPSVDPININTVEHKITNTSIQEQTECFSQEGSLDNDKQPIDARLEPNKAEAGFPTLNDSYISSSDLNHDSDDTDREGSIKMNYSHETVLTSTKIRTSGSVLHGNVHITPISKTSELKIHNLIMKNLEHRRVTDLTRSQMLSIPIVNDGHNIVLIGPPRTKKTSGWLIPLLNNLLNEKEINPRNSPRCVILTPGSNRVRYVARLCSAYVGAKLVTIATHGGGLELERKDELLSGVDILISTPRCCLRLFGSKYIINPERLRYFVIDTAQDVLKRFAPEINKFKNGINHLKQEREVFLEETRMQIVICGTTWTKEVDDFALNWLKDPVICLTSYLEAAVYSRINAQLHMLDQSAKIEKLFEMISKEEKVRTAILCCNTEEVKLFRAKLCNIGREILVAHGDIHHTLISDIQDSWNKSKLEPILICSDFMQHELDISNVKWLIHFSLPVNKSDFRDRFKFITDSFKDRSKKKSNSRPDCKVDIFLDEKTHCNFPKIIELLERLELPVSENFKNDALEETKRQEREKQDVIFCDGILQFGSCWKARCRLRHEITSKDISLLEPKVKDFVRIQIIDMLSPTHIIGRLISYSNKLLINEVLITSKFTYISLSIAEYFMEETNRVIHLRPTVGDIVAIEFKECLFERVKIIEILERDSRFNPTEVLVFLIDKGISVKEKTVNLLCLPTNLQIIPGEAINIYITGLIPIDLDHCWSYTSNKFIKEKVMGFTNDGCIVIGQVQLIFGRDLLLDKLMFYKEHSEGSAPWLIESLRMLITSSNFGIYNPQHKTVLQELAVSAGILNLDEVEDKVFKKQIPEESYWAYLFEDEEYVVNLIIAEDVKMFFVRLVKFLSCVSSLEQDLTNLLTKETHLLEEFDEGTFCAVKLPGENRFNRGMIIEPVDSYINEKTEVEVFFVDYGDRIVFQKSEVFVLPKGFISRLPFQAIECELAGIYPENDKNDEARDALYRMTSIGERWHSIFLKVTGIHPNAELTGGARYEVVLYNTVMGTDILINEEIVNLGFAFWDKDKDNILSFKKSQGQTIVPSLKEEEKTPLNSEEDWNSLNPEFETDKSRDVGLINIPLLNEDEVEIVGDFLSASFPYLLNMNETDFNSPQGLSSSSVKIEEIEPSKGEQETGEEILYTENKFNCECELKFVGVYTPTVHWRQSTTYVWIKILIPDVGKFKMEWTMDYINFQTENAGKLYWLDIDLFGSINPDTVMHKVRGLYFEIRLTKLLTGHYWPRILYSQQKARNIIHDPDKIAVEEDECDKEDKSLIPSYIARSETTKNCKEITGMEVVKKFHTKFHHLSLEDGSIGSSCESDIDDFCPIPEGNDEMYED